VCSSDLQNPKTPFLIGTFQNEIQNFTTFEIPLEVEDSPFAFLKKNDFSSALNRLFSWTLSSITPPGTLGVAKNWLLPICLPELATLTLRAPDASLFFISPSLIAPYK